MSATILRKPALTAAAVLLLATACAALTPAATRLGTAALHGLHDLLSMSGHPGQMSPVHVVLVAAVLFLAGVVSGLAGFAFSAVAAGILWLLPPLQAVPLIMLLSACNQLLSIGKLRHEMAIWSSADCEGALPYIVGGLAGVPLGVALLRALPPDLIAGGLGAFLVVYAFAMLLMPGCLRIGACGRMTAVAVGALGGVVGGFSGFGASALVVYLGLRGANKSVTRGITQPYIFTMQLVSLAALAATEPAVFDAFFWFLWALALPAVLLGSNTGVALYHHLNDRNFRRAVLLLLIASGASLIAKSMI
ncbi:MAG TPA: sulfite exporter TauE/SafE family protein [Stellaceae bacterium]|nr:sulfite exporter TauE/SafE family protein [Stellaceae bacterium]